MNHGQITVENQDCLVPEVSTTTNFLERMCGLLFRPALTASQGLLIVPCSSVHTFGMRYSIDLVFIDQNWTIVKTVNRLKPWRVAACKSATMVLELAANRINELQLTPGLQLVWQRNQNE